MKIKILHIALAMAMIFGSVGIAAAEPTLDKILQDKYTVNNYNFREVTSTNDYVLKPATYATVTIYTKVDDHEASYSDPTGWYVAGTGVPSSFNQLFNNPQDGQYKSFTTNGQFGIYIHSDGYGYIYSQNSLNSRKLVRLFQVDKNKDGSYDNDNCYVFAFEDIIPNSASDSDYQDVVIEVSSDSQLTLVPEFPTVAVPVAAVLGLLFMFGRKKEKL
jgi:hypothetical protein